MDTPTAEKAVNTFGLHLSEAGLTMDALTAEKAVNTFGLHLSEHACDYFTEFREKSVNVSLVSSETRHTSRLYRYLISAGDLKRSVLIKTPPAVPLSEKPEVDTREWAKRPQLALKVEPKVKHKHEYVTLSAIQRHFKYLDDSRYGTINVLDYLPEHAALIMEELNAQNLRHLFGRTHRLQLSSAAKQLQVAFFNAGMWLRHYHSMPNEDMAQIRQAGRNAFIDSINLYQDYLGSELHHEAFFQRVATWTIAKANELLPEDLPLGLGHGDYAMRNILVGDNSSVTVIDTAGRWRVPIYEDIGYFLIRMKATSLQVFTLGMAYSPEQLAKYEEQFLRGYFGEEQIPLETIRLFEIQALLDNWSANVVKLSKRPASASKSILQKAGFALVNRYYGSTLLRSLGNF